MACAARSSPQLFACAARDRGRRRAVIDRARFFSARRAPRPVDGRARRERSRAAARRSAGDWRELARAPPPRADRRHAHRDRADADGGRGCWPSAMPALTRAQPARPLPRWRRCRSRRCARSSEPTSEAPAGERRRRRASNGDGRSARDVPAMGTRDARRARGAAGGGSLGAAGAGRARAAAAGARLDPRPLVPDPGVPRFIESLELEWPIDALEPLSFVLARLLDPLSAALERADRGAAALRLDLRLVDRTTHARVLQLPAPMRDARVLRTLLLLDLESHPPPAARRHRHDRDRSGAGAHHPVLAARARAAVAGNAGDAHRAARRAGRREPLRIAGARRHVAARWRSRCGGSPMPDCDATQSDAGAAPGAPPAASLRRALAGGRAAAMLRRSLRPRSVAADRPMPCV